MSKEVLAYDRNGTPLCEGDLVKGDQERSIRGIPKGALLRLYGPQWLRSDTGKKYKHPYLDIIGQVPPARWAWKKEGRPVCVVTKGKVIGSVVKHFDTGQPKRICAYCGDKFRPKTYTMLVDGEWDWTCIDTRACDETEIANKKNENDEIEKELVKKLAENQRREREAKRREEELKKKEWIKKGKYEGKYDQEIYWDDGKQKIIDEALDKLKESSEDATKSIKKFNSGYRTKEEQDKLMKKRYETDENGIIHIKSQQLQHTACGHSFCTEPAGHEGPHMHTNVDGDVFHI